MHCGRLCRRRKHVVVHRDHHRDEDDGVVEEVQLDARHPQLHDAGRHRPAEEVVAEQGLQLQQQVLEVVEELDPQRDRPPQAIVLPGESRPQQPEAGQHHERVAVMQRFRLDQPGKEIAEHAARFGHRPAEPVNLIRLQQVLGPVRQDDDREDPQRELVSRTVETLDQRRSWVRRERTSACAYMRPVSEYS